MSFFFSSSSEIGASMPQHQVFINFRGAELREGFVRVLVQALQKEKVNIFVDEQEVRGRVLTSLFDTIRNSKIAIVIFSERYTESKWCLDELAKIKERMDQGKLRAIPVFFDVETEDVKNLRGNFGHNFRNLKRTSPRRLEETAKWKEAVKYVSRTSDMSSELRYQRVLRLDFFDRRAQKTFAESVAVEVKKMLSEISRREEEEEERIRQTREGEQLAIANQANHYDIWYYAGLLILYLVAIIRFILGRPRRQ